MNNERFQEVGLLIVVAFELVDVDGSPLLLDWTVREMFCASENGKDVLDIFIKNYFLKLNYKILIRETFKQKILTGISVSIGSNICISTVGGTFW